MNLWIGVLAFIAFVTISILAARVAFRLPSLKNRHSSEITKPALSGKLHDAVIHQVSDFIEVSGVYALNSGHDAFATRALLADIATQSIDVQYYIWHQDLTGLLLLKALKKAADRGVKIRLLLDDNGINGLDPILSELDAHPYVEVRIYNPFANRNFKLAGYLYDFGRLNRRMHNKSFTVDGLATIVGGRNIGDEYFDTGSQPIFIDLDVLAVGEVVGHVSHDFVRYWSSASSYPLELLVRKSSSANNILEDAVAKVSNSNQYKTYMKELGNSQIINELIAGDLPLEWTEVRLISDSPLKTLRKAKSDQLLVGQIAALMKDVTVSIDVVSPYFVPGKKGVQEFAKLKSQGVEVRILTNSMSANDVKLVHSGYAKYRNKLLRKGIDLFELKAQFSPADDRRSAGFAGSSGSSLHAKTFATDEKRIYIGSFNFDPRSVQLNTEMGFLIESETMARSMKEAFDDSLKDIAYVLEYEENQKIKWLDSSAEEGSRVHNADPETTMVERGLVTFLGYLPIQWLL